MVRPSRRGVADPSSPRPSGADFTTATLARGSSAAAAPARDNPQGATHPYLGQSCRDTSIRDRRPGRPSSCSAARPGVHNGQVTKRGRRWGYSDERVSVKKQSRKKDAGAVLCRPATCGLSRETSSGGDVHTHGAHARRTVSSLGELCSPTVPLRTYAVPMNLGTSP
jgi:hypothetical protein